MLFDLTSLDKIRQELKKPLPGEDAQYRMAPSYRPKLSKNDVMELSPRMGGVMLLLYEKQNDLTIAFTKRREYKGVHSGQISFPGGKHEDGDESIVQTAFRETQEEIGISADKIELVGNLTELYIPPSNFLVHPVVGFANSLPEFTPEEKEVEQILEIPLSHFMNEANINLQTEIRLFNNNRVTVPAYHYKGHVIWGATAIMMSEFTFIVEKAMKR